MEEDSPRPRPRPLPDDVLADILARLAPSSLAVSRRVCREWRAIVDDRCLPLLRPDLLLATVGGIVVDSCSYRTDEPDFFARPSTARGRWVAGSLRHESFVRMDQDDGVRADYTHCCNGLLLLDDFYFHKVVVVNPATRWSARLPRWDGGGMGSYWYYLAFDPRVSPHYEVISMPLDPFFDDDKEKKPLEGLGPPPVYVVGAYSSRTAIWEERRFALDHDDEKFHRNIDGVMWGYGHGAYWRGVLYVYCNNRFMLRINLSHDKYQVIDLPAHTITNDDLREVYLGKSQNGIYFAAIINDTCRVLIWFLDESDGKMEWVLKHSINQHDLITPFCDSLDAQTDRPSIPQEDNLDQELKLGPILEVEESWDSDDDKAMETKDKCDTKNTYGFMIFGLHPYKEIMFLYSSRVVAYHFGSSKIQDLGELPLRFRYPNDLRSFVYTPCWLGELSETNY